MRIDTLEQIAEQLGWSPERLAQAQSRDALARESNVGTRDKERAEMLSELMEQTRSALDEAS